MIQDEASGEVRTQSGFGKTVFLILICVHTFSFVQISTGKLSEYSLAPITLHGTVISASFSYPGNFHFDEEPSIYPRNPIYRSTEDISLSVSTTFNDASIQAVNITSISFRLYSMSVNLTEAACQIEPPVNSLSEVKAYAYADWYSKNSYSKFNDYSFLTFSNPYQIRAASIGQPVSLTTNPMKLEWNYKLTSVDNALQAKLFVQIRFCLLDSAGNAIDACDAEDLNEYSSINVTSIASMVEVSYFTTETETPNITINPPVEYVKAQSVDLNNLLTFIILISILALFGYLVVLRKARVKVDSKERKNSEIVTDLTEKNS